MLVVIMARLVFGLLGLAAVCVAAPHKVDPQDEKGNGKHSYNVAHLGHNHGPEIGPPQDSDDTDRDYPGGGTFPGGGGGYFSYGSPHRSSRVRRYDGEHYGPVYHRRPYSHGQGHGNYAYPVPVLVPQQSHSYSKASASASSGSGGFHG